MKKFLSLAVIIISVFTFCTTVFSIQGAGDDGYWTAHAVAAFGYVETDNAKYLKVADGNYSSQRYLNYDYYGVHEGFCVYIY